MYLYIVGIVQVLCSLLTTFFDMGFLDIGLTLSMGGLGDFFVVFPLYMSDTPIAVFLEADVQAVLVAILFVDNAAVVIPAQIN